MNSVENNSSKKSADHVSTTQDKATFIRNIGFYFYRNGDLDSALSAMKLACKLKPGSPFLMKRVDKIKAEIESASQGAIVDGEKSKRVIASKKLYVSRHSQEDYASMYEEFREAAVAYWEANKEKFTLNKIGIENVVDKIEKAYKNQKGLSVIRSGDGEGSFLSRRFSACHQDLFYLCARGSLRLHFGHQDFSYDDLDFWSNELLSAFMSSDIITSARDEGSVDRLLAKHHGFDFRSMVGQIAGSIIPCSIAKKLGNLVYESGYLHRDLIPYYQELFKNKEVVLIGPNDEKFAEHFEAYFDCTVTDILTIPGQYVVEKEGLKQPLFPDLYQSTLSRLLELDVSGKMCLVGAGLAGKVFCSKIALKGGVGLDVGSMMDAWVGRKARKYHTSEFLGASTVIKS